MCLSPFQGHNTQVHNAWLPLAVEEGHSLRRLHQNSDALLNRDLGFGTENCIIIVTDWVRNDGKQEPWPPRYLSHHLGRLHKAIRNDGGGGNAGTLGGHGVV